MAHKETEAECKQSTRGKTEVSLDWIDIGRDKGDEVSRSPYRSGYRLCYRTSLYLDAVLGVLYAHAH